MGGGGAEKKGGDPWPWLRRQWRNYAGVKTTMAATRHSSSNQRFSLHSRPQSYDPLLKILTIYENKMGRSTLASFPLCLHFPFLYLTFNPTAERWEALDLGGRCESSPPLAGQAVKTSALFQKVK